MGGCFGRCRTAMQVEWMGSADEGSLDSTHTVWFE